MYMSESGLMNRHFDLGLLAAATNTIKHTDGTSTVLKYNEPPEARKPTDGWRLYVFKGKEQVGTFP